MATVVDALIVTLGLDPTQFNKGQKEAANAFLKTRQEAEKSGKIIEDSAKKTADAISKVTREVLTLYATFLGARGLKEFVAQLNTADAALGRFSANLGQSPQTIAAWGMATERMGGSAEATAGSFERIGKALYDLHRNGQLLPKEFSQLQALTGKRIDTEHGVDKFLQDTAAALKAMNAIDPTQAHFLAQGMGIDDATANTMIKYGDAIGAYLDQIKKLSPSNDAIKAAQKLQEQWAILQQNAVALANVVLEKLGPSLAKLLEQMTDWLAKNQDWLQSGIVKAVGDFANYLAKVDWAAIGNGLKDFGNDAKHVADAIGGITTATEVLFALWAGSKALGMLGSLRNVLGGSAAPVPGGSASSGILGKLGVAAAGIGLAIWGAEKYKERSAAGLVETPEQHERIKKFNQMRAGNKAWANSVFGETKNSSGSPDDRDTGYYNRTSSLDSLINGDTKIDGRSVSKSNPMPVTIQQQGSGGGFWQSVGNFFGGLLGGGGGSGGGSSPAASANNDVGPVQATGKSAGVRGWWTKERQQHAYERLTKEGGLSDQGAKALISRWMNVEASGGPGEVNSIGATGIAQMLGPRKRRLLQMAQEQGVSYKDYDLQLSHIIEELKGSERKAGDRLRAAKTAQEGAIGASMFERAEGYNALTGRDNFTGRTLGGMRGIGDYVGSVMTGQTLSNIQNNHTATTSNTASHNVSIATMNINAPQATDSRGIGATIADSLFRSTVAATANTGPQ